MRVEQKVSKNIIDRRKHVGAGVIAGVLATVLAVLGVNLFTGGSSDRDRDLVFVVSSALDRGQLYWSAQVPGYRDAKVVLFEQSTETGCGHALSASGPFWCSADDRIFMDLGFLRAVDGDLGKAVVVGHELAHHVQSLTGQMNRGRASVDIELQADCLAGRWIANDRKLGNVAPADIASAVSIIERVGDDRVCVGCSPDTWKHGSSGQRVAALLRGIDGDRCGL